MAQKIWSEYFQIGNASAEEAIPGAIIHMQTRDGNDEALTGAVNMQWDDNAGLFLPTDKDNPLEARVRHLEALVGALNATKETNPDAASATLLALLRGLMATGATESTLGSVKTAAEALAGTIDSGALKTTLTGRNVGIHTLIDAVEIRDTNSFSGGTVAGSVLAAYKELDLFAIDSHNQPIQMVFTTGSDPAFTANHYRVRGASDWSARPTTITDANSLNRPLVLRSDANIGAFLASRVWAVAGIGVRVGIPGSAPESGALTVVAIGVIN